MRESAFQSQVIQFLRNNNCYVENQWGGGKYGAREGTPDLLACIDGTFHGIELKNETGTPSKMQLYKIQKIKDAGGEAYILRPQNFEEWKSRWFE